MGATFVLVAALPLLSTEDPGIAVETSSASASATTVSDLEEDRMMVDRGGDDKARGARVGANDSENEEESSGTEDAFLIGMIIRRGFDFGRGASAPSSSVATPILSSSSSSSSSVASGVRARRKGATRLVAT